MVPFYMPAKTPPSYLVDVDVVEVIRVVYGFNETLELPCRAAVDHQDKNHTDGVLGLGQAVVQLAKRLNCT